MDGNNRARERIDGKEIKTIGNKQAGSLRMQQFVEMWTEKGHGEQKR